MRTDACLPIAMVMALMTAGCGSPDRAADAPVTATASISEPVAKVSPMPVAARPVARVARTGLRSCGEEIGAVAAARRVAICRTVSPATHPPCNAANSCALIEDEIARSCALFEGDGAPMQGCGPDPRSGAAAADVVRRYYSAIDARDYATAWQQWGDGGRPGQRYGDFAKGFARTRSTRVTIGPLPPSEGAAGSSYQTVPVTVTAMLDNGGQQDFTGDYIVRRINDVDGSSAAQRRWRLESATLRSLPVARR